MGAWLKEYRTEAGLTQRELAAEFNRVAGFRLTDRAVASWEQGRGGIRAEALLLVALRHPSGERALFRLLEAIRGWEARSDL